MQIQAKITGITGIVMHDGIKAFDPTTEEKREMAEIARKRGSNRTEADEARLRELECRISFWLTEDGTEKPTIPARALRTCIEKAARKLKQGPMVREGLFVDSVDSFTYDDNRYGKTLDELALSAQFTVPVVVQRQRIARTRALFDPPWECTFTLDCEDDLVDRNMLDAWLGIAGRRVGLGDWRPEKSGTFGRFTHELLGGE